MKIKTKDIWLSSFCLAKGAELDEVSLSNNGSRKKEVTFVFRGVDAGDLQKEFVSGQALRSVARLRASMIHLKEQMYRIIDGR